MIVEVTTLAGVREGGPGYQDDYLQSHTLPRNFPESLLKDWLLHETQLSCRTQSVGLVISGTTSRISCRCLTRVDC